MNSIAASARTDGDDRIADALRDGENQILLVEEADTHRVDERVALVGFVERDFASNGRNTDAIAVIADAFDDARKEVAHARCVERSESQ